jgi:hypothetical protein
MSTSAVAGDALREGAAISLRERVARVLTGLPDWALLTWLTVTIAALNVDVARGVQAPSVFNDEGTYSRLATDIASTRIHGIVAAAKSGYGVIYPLLLAPLYAWFDTVPAAYAATKVLNGVLLATAVFPAFLIARRVLPRKWAVAATVAATVGPQTVFASLVMTESVAYPLMLWAILAITVALEQPTSRNQFVALAAIVICVGTRMQAVALFPGLIAAGVVYVVSDRRRGYGQRLRPFLPTGLALGTGAIAAFAYVLARSATSAVGAYGVIFQQGYSPLSTLRWTAGNLADFDLLLGFGLFLVMPAAVASALRGASATSSSRATAAAFVGLGSCSLLMVAAFSGTPQGGDRDHQRYLVYFLPSLIVLCFRWLNQDGVWSRRTLLLSGAITVALPAALPLERMQKTAWVDSFGAQPWLNGLLPLHHLRVICLAVCLVVVSSVLLLSGSRQRTLIVSIFWVTSLLAFTAVGAHSKAAGRYAVHRPDWIDRAVGSSAQVDVLFVQRPCLDVFARNDRYVRIWRAMFFNRSVRLRYFVGERLPNDHVSRRLVLDTAANPRGQVAHSRLLLVQPDVHVSGAVVANEPSEHLALIRPTLPLRIQLRSREFLYGCRTQA